MENGETPLISEINLDIDMMYRITSMKYGDPRLKILHIHIYVSIYWIKLSVIINTEKKLHVIMCNIEFINLF